MLSSLGAAVIVLGWLATLCVAAVADVGGGKYLLHYLLEAELKQQPLPAAPGKAKRWRP